MTGGGNGKGLKVRTAERLDPERTAFLIILITSIIKMFFALKGIFCITDHDIQLIDINTMKLGDTGHPGYINYLIEHMAFPPIIKEYLQREISPYIRGEKPWDDCCKRFQSTLELYVSE